MARGRKSALSLSEQIEKITIEIENMESTLKELKKTKKNLEERNKQEKLIELDNIISEKELSLDEVKALLENEQKNNKK